MTDDQAQIQQTQQVAPNKSEEPDADQTSSESLYIGVVAGGYEDPVETDKFKVTVNADAAARFNRNVGRWTIVRVEADAWRRDGRRFQQRSFGVVEDMRVLPGQAFLDSKQMAHSSYYRTDEFHERFSSTAEDALELTVRSVGHARVRGQEVELYGPVRPPERESRIYLAQPAEVRAVLLRPMPTGARFRIGAYATFDGLYQPVTDLALPHGQMFLHGAIFAASGWGKTVLIKHLIQEFHSVQQQPAIIVFNIKGQDYYGLDEPLSVNQWNSMEQRNPDVARVWTHFNYSRQGMDQSRVSYYPISQGPRGRTGYDVYSLQFSEIPPNEAGAAFIRLIFDGFGLTETAMNQLIEYFFFFKRHGTSYAEEYTGHPPARLSAAGRARPIADTLSNFITLLRDGRNAARGSTFYLNCEQPDSETHSQTSPEIYTSSAGAILRALGEVERFRIFDRGEGGAVNIQRLLTPGHVSIIDVANITSPRAQETYIQYLLHSLFTHINTQQYISEQEFEYRGVVLFLDEAWRFFRSSTVLDEVETISRMGRSLRIGLWLADQNVPSGEAQETILNNIRTRVLGTMAIEPRQLKKIMPLDERVISALGNLQRGTGMFFNQEYSRMPVPFVVPPCRCYHEDQG